jgi:hypothetical protein
VDDDRVDDLEPGRGGKVRRGMLRGLAAGVAAVAIGRFGGATAAKRKKKKPLCKRCPKFCEAKDVVLCRPTPNPETVLCVCARTTAGGSTCVNVRAGDDCSATDQCRADADCPSNNACITVHAITESPAGCCDPGMTGNLCKPICT